MIIIDYYIYFYFLLLSLLLLSKLPKVMSLDGCLKRIYALLLYVLKYLSLPHSGSFYGVFIRSNYF